MNALVDKILKVIEESVCPSISFICHLSPM